jgi:hypothetical protein
MLAVTFIYTIMTTANYQQVFISDYLVLIISDFYAYLTYSTVC